jgi:hypothetical protein
MGGLTSIIARAVALGGRQVAEEGEHEKVE